MTGQTRTTHQQRRDARASLAIGTLLSLLVVGCGGSDHPPRQFGSRTSAAAQAATRPALHVVATLTTPPASSLVATPDRLWVLGGPSGVLTQVDPATNSVVRKVRTPHPPGFGTYADGSLWIASLLDSAVMELDAGTGRALRTIESTAGKPFHRPIGVAATGKDLWVLNHGDESVRSTLTRLDPRTGTVLGTTDLPGHHAGGPLVAAGQLWITLTQEGTVVRVDPATGRIVGKPILVDTGTCLSASVADGDPWYTGLEADDGTCHDAARRVDAGSAKLSPVVYGPGKSLVNFASAGGSVWASDIGHTLYHVDTKTGAIRPSLTLDGPDAPNQLLVAFGSIWVLSGPTGRLTRVDLS
jgi:streptogramin lyase